MATYSVADVADPGWITQIGVAPVRVDLISSIPGVESFNTAWKNRIQARFGDVPANYIGLDELIRSAGSAARQEFIRIAVLEAGILRIDVARHLRVAPSTVTWHLRRKN